MPHVVEKTMIKASDEVERIFRAHHGLMHIHQQRPMVERIKAIGNVKLKTKCWLSFLFNARYGPIRLRWHQVLLCVILLGVTPALAEDSANAEGAKVVEQYVKALGGVHRLSQIRTLSLQGTAISGGENSPGTYTLDTKLPNRYYLELNVGPHHLIEASNGKSAWHRDASGSLLTLFSPDSLEIEAKAQIANTRLLNLKKNKLLPRLVGPARVGDKDALQVELSTAAGVKQEFFFDPQTHLLIKQAETIGGATEEISYGDYRPEAGVEIAHQLELRRGSETYAIQITNVSVNGSVGERVFDLPFTSQVKLPDLKLLFKELDDNQKAIDKLKENYAGTRTEETTEYDSQDKVKKRTVTESTFLYFGGEEISTVVRRNGQPLSAAEEKEEQENAQKRIEQLKKERGKKDAQEEKAKAEGKPEKEKEDDSNVGIDMFLRSCDFVNPRRERYRGRDALVFDFEGNRDYKPRNLAERIVQKLAGTIWIDEKAYDVARLEAHFGDTAKIAFGLLATVQKGTYFVMEQEFVNNEVWLPTYEEGHLGARVLLLKGFRVGEVVRYSGYKKLPLTSRSERPPL